ncbi:MAG: Trm112 family protein [Pseudomonadota bacterium]
MSSPFQVDPKMLDMLVCPVSRASLKYDEENQELISTAARLAYPVRDGIPVLIASEARELEENEE